MKFIAVAILTLIVDKAMLVLSEITAYTPYLEPKLPILDANFNLMCPLALKMHIKFIQDKANKAFQLNKDPNTRLPEYRHSKFPGQILYTYPLNDLVSFRILAQNHMVIDSAGYFLHGFTRIQSNGLESETPCVFSKSTNFGSYHDTRFVF
ncbi:CSEP0356 putative effector protein [Blumeria hordei DH14]|uniref:CSEP0356 putative effector protein n=1 Tax=Blumeria graminis f. sp. hordei (strain DH14) TaxID=546991 RepID=N1JA41_BLUG1|nr:CSEP0356 putative effector protein [Blumeria hordei DH14]